MTGILNWYFPHCVSCTFFLMKADVQELSISIYKSYDFQKPWASGQEGLCAQSALQIPIGLSEKTDLSKILITYSDSQMVSNITFITPKRNLLSKVYHRDILFLYQKPTVVFLSEMVTSVTRRNLLPLFIYKIMEVMGVLSISHFTPEVAFFFFFQLFN